MSKLRSAVLPVVLVSLIASAIWAEAADRPFRVGREVTVKEDLTVFPNGAGLPKGSGSVRAGRDVYAARCAACHGDKAKGNDNYPALAGGRGSLRSAQPELTVGSYWPHATTLWDYTRRAMPYQQPGTLTDNEVYAVTAYMLHLNGILDEAAVLDETTLPKIEMPNKRGFVADTRPDFKTSKRSK